MTLSDHVLLVIPANSRKSKTLTHLQCKYICDKIETYGIRAYPLVKQLSKERWVVDIKLWEKIEKRLSRTQLKNTA